MTEEIAVRESAGTSVGTERPPEHRILAEGVVRQGATWVSPDCATDAGTWNALADENAIHAAISTFDERKEEMKSRENVAFILAHTEPGTRILDLGCGYGRLAKYLLPVRKFEAYIGVDCSPVMLRKFHERYAATDAERGTPLTLVRGDIERIPLKDASVDACVVSAVYLHNHKDVTKASIAEIRRVLKPGGRFIILGSFPNGHSLAGIQGGAYLTYLKAIGQERRNGPVRYFGQGEVRDLLAGFDETRIHPFGFSVLPKTLHGLPKSLRRPYRLLYDRIHASLTRLVPESIRRIFCVYFDVVARKDADA